MLYDGVTLWTLYRSTDQLLICRNDIYGNIPIEFILWSTLLNLSQNWPVQVTDEIV